MIIKPYNGTLSDGLWSGVPMGVYQNHPALSSTMLRVLMESPLTYRRTMDGAIRREPTDAQSYGTIQHAMLLEGREEFYVRPETYGPDNKKWNANAAECKQWLAEHSDKPCLSPREANELRVATEYLHDHSKASKLLKGGAAEVSIICGDHKARADYLILDSADNTAAIVDLKTCADASTQQFGREIMNWGYHIQAAWYVRVLKELGVTVGNFFFVALQKGAPLVNVWSLSERAIELGNLECERALTLRSQCIANNFWPEWSDYDGTDAITTLDLPEWAYPESDEVDVSSGEMQPTEL